MNRSQLETHAALVRAAHAYARRGWAVLPCHSLTGRSCTCGVAQCASPAKHPLTRHGLHDASTRHDVIARWWTRWPHANVGLRTGKVSGIVVIDVDPAHGGGNSLTALIERHEPMPHTMTVHTGGGGLHLYFRHPGGELRNSSGTVLGDGIDVRGDGGYVLAPPSLHASASHYRWATGARLATLPDWLHERLERRHDLPTPQAPSIVRVDRGVSAWARAAVDGELSRVRTAPAGRRNHTLNRSAFVLGQIVGAGHLTHEDVATMLVGAATAAGLGERESRATVASGLRAGEQQPRSPEPTESRASATRHVDADRLVVPDAGAGPDLRTIDLLVMPSKAPERPRPGPTAEVSM